MTTATKFKRLSLAVIAGGLLAGVTLGALPAAAQEAPAQSPPAATTDDQEPTQIPDSQSATVTPEGQALGLAFRVDLDTQPRPDTLGENYIPLIVTITENGGPTTVDYDVFANAKSPDGDTMPTDPCLERWYTSTTTPRGIFWCTVIVDSPNRWSFFAFVNKRQGAAGAEAEENMRTADQVVLNYGQAQVGVECLEANGCVLLKSKGEVEQVSGDASSVGFLSIHTIFASGWFLCIGLLVLLSLAGGRQFLSDRGRHILESQLDRIITGAKATTLAVAGTGIYLMFRETAYSTPSTPDKLDAVFDFAYGQPYFMSLFTKITIYAVLVAFSFVLIREARRRSTTVVGGNTRRRAGKEVSADDIWGSENWEKKAPAGGGTAVMVDEPQVMVDEETDTGVDADPTRPGARIAFLATVLGTVGIWFCVVLLKYFHQLIEAARTAASSVGG